jgi:general stress protein 26
MNTKDVDIEISNLLLKAQNIIDNISLLSKDNKKYVLSQACSENMELYFKTIKKLEKLKSIKHCNHNYICISKGEDVYYECINCKIIL